MGAFGFVQICNARAPHPNPLPQKGERVEEAVYSSPVTQDRSILKIALVALAGTSIEWFDFFLYGTASALVFPTLFFPKELPPLVGLLASFSTNAVGFIARPVGGILFGHFGDRHGRKRALVTALTLMGVATTLIGCLPSYETAGVAAPVMLVLLRFAQGLAVGGQWGGAMLLVTESAPKGRRGYYGSFAQAGAPAGVVLANVAFLLVSASVSQQAFMSWGWRLPFLASVLIIGLALYVQLRLEDTAAYRQLIAERGEEARGKRRSPVLEALRSYPKQIALAAGAFVAIQIMFYILITFVVAYGANEAVLGLPRDMMLSAVLVGTALMLPTTLIAAAISDRYGRRGIYMAGAVLACIWSFVLFPLVETRSFLWITVAIAVGQTAVAMMYGPQAAFFAELFSTRMRYSAASLGYQIGSIFGGAFAPLIATALFARFRSSFAISLYMAFACVVTFLSVFTLEETHRRDLEDASRP